MREQHDQAEQRATERAAADETVTPETKVKKPRTRKSETPKAAKVKTPPKPRKKAVKVPVRMVARWAVCDSGLKRVAVFDYKDRTGADAKLEEMLVRKPGAFYLQLVKDPYDPPAAIEPVVAV